MLLLHEIGEPQRRRAIEIGFEDLKSFKIDSGIERTSVFFIGILLLLLARGS